MSLKPVKHLVAGWCNQNIVAPMTFKGYCNSQLIEAWVEQILVPELKPGQVVVMDQRQLSTVQSLSNIDKTSQV